MSTTEILNSANQILKDKVSTLTVSKMKPSGLSFGCQMSNGITVLFGSVYTYIQFDGILYKAI